MGSLGLVCVGAGRGERFGGDKLSSEVGGASVLELSLSALHAAFPDAPLEVVVPAHRIPYWRSRVARHPAKARLIAGGERRQDSVRNGVAAVASSGADVVLIHDAARPLVHLEDVRATVDGLGKAAGVVLCAAIADTVKRVGDDGRVVETVDRSDLRAALTPQVFRVEALRLAWSKVDDGTLWTDEAALMEAAGLEVRWVQAAHPNPKLTTPADLELLRAMWGTRG